TRGDRFDNAAQPETLHEHERREQGAHPRRVWEQRADQRTLESIEERSRMVLFHVGPRALDQTSVVHAGRTSGLASATAKTKVQMSRSIGVEREPPLGKRLHQVDAATRRVHLRPRHQISGASLQAQSAMDAVKE